MYIVYSGKYIRKVLLIAVIILAAVTVYGYNFKGIPEILLGKKTVESLNQDQFELFYVNQRFMKHNITVEKYYEKRKNWVTSNLGSVLFKNSAPPPAQNRTFVVLIWKYYNWLQHRHIEGFNKEREHPLEDCSVKNCIFTGDDDDMNLADAVVVHIQHGEIPHSAYRKPDQRWVFLSDESPVNQFSMAKVKPRLRDWNHIFNWSMTYRSDSDVPVPYGRTLPLEDPLMLNGLPEAVSQYVPYWKIKRRDVLVTILMSNCGVSSRMKYLRELQKHIKVDVYGKCSKDNKTKSSCPGHFREDCMVVSEYLFYLVLENSQCRHYLTEKGFHNAYSKGAIPIIMGPPLEDCEKLLPPNSFIHVDSYESPEALAKEIERIGGSNNDIFSYHKWRNDFQVVNEHGYFESKSYHYCRICQALNYNSRARKSYSLLDMELFLDAKLLCKD